MSFSLSYPAAEAVTKSPLAFPQDLSQYTTQQCRVMITAQAFFEQLDEIRRSLHPVCFPDTQYAEIRKGIEEVQKTGMAGSAHLKQLFQKMQKSRKAIEGLIKGVCSDGITSGVERIFELGVNSAVSFCQTQLAVLRDNQDQTLLQQLAIPKGNFSQATDSMRRIIYRFIRSFIENFNHLPVTICSVGKMSSHSSSSSPVNQILVQAINAIPMPAGTYALKVRSLVSGVFILIQEDQRRLMVFRGSYGFNVATLTHEGDYTEECLLPFSNSDLNASECSYLQQRCSAAYEKNRQQQLAIQTAVIAQPWLRVPIVQRVVLSYLSYLFTYPTDSAFQKLTDANALDFDRCLISSQPAPIVLARNPDWANEQLSRLRE